MNKKFFATLIVAVVAAFAGYNMYQSQKTVRLSDLALANVEALANDTESGYDCKGCIITTISFCKYWGWGGCIGDSYIHPV